MNRILCLFGIHKYTKWMPILDGNNKPVIITFNDRISHLPIGQALVQLRECLWCGKVQIRRVDI